MLTQPKSDGHPLFTNVLEEDRETGRVRSGNVLKNGFVYFNH